MTGWNPDRRLLTIDEAAKSVGRSPSTVRRWISEGRLRPHARSGHRKLYLETDVLDAEAEARSNDTRIPDIPGQVLVSLTDG